MGRSPAPIGADYGCLIGGVSIGVGFDSAYAAKLFRPFERLHGDAELHGE